MSIALQPPHQNPPFSLLKPGEPWRHWAALSIRRLHSHSNSVLICGSCYNIIQVDFFAAKDCAATRAHFTVCPCGTAWHRGTPGADEIHSQRSAAHFVSARESDHPMRKFSVRLPGVPTGAGAMGVARWAPFVALFAVMLLASGCVVQPIVAGEGGMPLVVSNGAPVIAIAPVAAPSGTSISVAGAGWRPGEVIYINLEGRQGKRQLISTVAVLTADVEGRFSTIFVAPLDLFWRDATGTAVVAHSQATGASAAAPFVFSSATGTPSPAARTTTPTPTPTPTAAGPRPTASPSVGLARVTSRGLNMRAGPSVYYPVVRVLSYGTELVVLGQDRSSYWLYVALGDGTLGWVARAFTDFLGTAPIVPAPPLPPNRPTPWPTAMPHPCPPARHGWANTTPTAIFPARRSWCGKSRRQLRLGLWIARSWHPGRQFLRALDDESHLRGGLVPVQCPGRRRCASLGGWPAGHRRVARLYQHALCSRSVAGRRAPHADG